MIKKITCLVMLHSIITLHSMQKTIECNAPRYVFVNVITLMCPDRAKQEESVKASIMQNESYLSLAKLGLSALSENLDSSIKNALYAMLEKVEVPSSINYTHATDLYIDDLRKAPPIFGAFCTTQTKKEADILYEHIKDHFLKQDNPFKPQSGGWFPSILNPDTSNTKFKLLMEGLDLMFNDERRNTVLELCDKMLKILDTGKSRDLDIILTANMSDDCCRALLKTNNLHDFFKDIHASDKAGCLTSQKEFYEKFMQEKKENNIKPHECLVIDEHNENLRGAQILGMQTLYKYKNDKFHEQLKDILTLQKTSDKQ